MEKSICLYFLTDCYNQDLFIKSTYVGQDEEKARALFDKQNEELPSYLYRFVNGSQMLEKYDFKKGWQQCDKVWIAIRRPAKVGYPEDVITNIFETIEGAEEYLKNNPGSSWKLYDFSGLRDRFERDVSVLEEEDSYLKNK